jgi:hypothetical protein
MNFPLDVVIIATAVAVGVGLALTYRTFNPKRHHDHATTELLKHFFDGKSCAICKRPIPPVHLTGGLKPGLLNPTTHETYSWDEIPDADLSAALETYLPLCSACEVTESFRHRFPDRVFEAGSVRDTSGQNASAQDAHSDEAPPRDQSGGITNNRLATE